MPRDGQAVPQPDRTVVVATGNPHKVREIESILSPQMPSMDFVCISDLGDFEDPIEDGTTFLANATIKARTALRETGLRFAIADDSGLCVDGLGGAPGVYSARWAGVHGDDAANNRKLLHELADVDDADRRAHFHSTVVLLCKKGSDDTYDTIIGSGSCFGKIGRRARGTEGFGYDPLFLPDDTPGKTMAELRSEEKNKISHRRRALDDLVAKLRIGHIFDSA